MRIDWWTLALQTVNVLILIWIPARIEKENLLAQASQVIAKLRSEAEAAIARDRVAAEQAIIARASELAVEIAERLLGRLPPGVTLAMFLDGLCGALRALSPEDRGGFTSGMADHPIEVVAATLPSSAEIEQIRRALKEALGSEMSFKFRSDATLIAGIELHGRNTVVRNSWRADLDRIREELNRGKQLRRAR
jgi:F-type H+-transporting ATPase subunit b